MLDPGVGHSEVKHIDKTVKGCDEWVHQEHGNVWQRNTQILIATYSEIFT